MSNGVDYVREALRAFYRQEEISNVDFQCPLREQCHAQLGQDIHAGAEAHVGSRYGEPFKLVIVSLDPGNSADNLNKRTETIEKQRIENLNHHMDGTCTLLGHLLDMEGNVEIWKHFAMANSAKCCAGNDMRSVPKALFWKCAPYTLGEVSRLAPDVIVTQGMNASSWTFQKAVTVEAISSDKKSSIIQREFGGLRKVVLEIVQGIVERELKLIDLNGHKVIWMHSVHPSAWGNWSRFSEVQLPILSLFIRGWLRENGRLQ